MFKIAEKYPLNTSKTIFRVSIEAPLIAKSAQPGQFAIFRLDEFGERFPLTIADYDPEVGTVSFNFQPAGKSTQMFSDRKSTRLNSSHGIGSRMPSSA